MQIPTRVVIRQADLDTCAAAFLLGVTPEDHIVAVVGHAARKDLDDPGVLCIEAGDSGGVCRRNYDHHDPLGPTAPACRQALVALGREANGWQRRLVEYAERIDLGLPVRYVTSTMVGRTTLSGLISGIRLLEADAVTALRRGLDVLQTFHDESLDPFSRVGVRPAWQALDGARRAAARHLRLAALGAELFPSRRGALVGFLSSQLPGALAALYARGCDIGIAFRPDARKYTIGGRCGRRVDHLLPVLNACEAGWGGPANGGVIGSPFGGSALSPELIKDLIRMHA